MAPPHRFVNYPAAEEAPDVSYKTEVDKNPALRGLPIVLASTLIANSVLLQRYFWGNAGFGRIRLLPGLGEQTYRFQPLVIPLAEAGSPAGPPEFGPELYQRQPADLAGRFYSAADYHELYKAGQLTPVQVVEALLPLIRRGQSPASDYSTAWTDVDADRALAAAEASSERWAAGSPLGILDGVPFGVKSDTDVKGYVSTFGMRVDKSVPFFTTPAQETIWPVKKLEEAGAIMVGKMNQHEIGMDTTGCNPSTGTPRNWFNKSYYPGGSSSGAGSALGAGLVPITVGTDSGGSVRIPPTFNGVYGLKVSFNRTCTRKSSVCIVGPMCATVADLTIAYRIMAQPNPEDSVQGLFAPSIPPEPSAKRYIGICRPWVNRSAPPVLEAYQKIVDYLTDRLDYEVVDIGIPYLREGQLALSAICLTEGAEEAKGRVGNESHWLSLLNCPNKVLMGAGSQTPAVDYIRYGQLRETLMRHMAYLFQKYPGLLVVTPTTPNAGWPIHPGDQKYGFSDGNVSILTMTYSWLANMVGCPAVSCPMGYADPKQGEGRVPMAVMAMGEWGAEEQVLAFARDTETYLNEAYPGGRLRPKEWADVIALARANPKGAQTVSNGH